MKFFHLSDLHLGKRVHEVLMLEAQWDILQKIVAHAKEHKPDAILIAGDVYDKDKPIVEAVQLLDRFLVWLNELGIAVFMISGNHDSAERVAFGAELLKNSNVHIVQAYNGNISPIPFTDAHGEVSIWMLPHLKPSTVRKHFPEKVIVSASDAITAALSNALVDDTKRNILVAHQFVTGAVTSESEEIYVGGDENVDGSIFDAFDYVALGHLHRPQNVGRRTLRYCGTPLMYSFSEINHEKSITVVDMGAKGNIEVSEIPLVPMRMMKEIKGTYTNLMSREFYSNIRTDDYIRIVLTDEQEEPEARYKLGAVYPNIMQLLYDNQRTRTISSFETVPSTEKKAPLELLGDFFYTQNGRKMDEEQYEYANELLKEIWEEVAIS